MEVTEWSASLVINGLGPELVLVALGIATVVAVLLLLLPSARPPSRDEDFSTNSSLERRQFPRRAGDPMQVRLRSLDKNGDYKQGFVVERSEGGMRLAVRERLLPGNVVQLRADEAPEEIPCVLVIVRHRRRVGDYYEVGCEFQNAPPWEVLVTFG